MKEVVVIDNDIRLDVYLKNNSIYNYMRKKCWLKKYYGCYRLFIRNCVNNIDENDILQV